MLPPVPASLAIGTGRLLEAQALHRAGRVEDVAVAHFELALPQGVAFGVAAGLATVLEEIVAWHVPAEALGSLAAEADAQGRAFLAPAFVDWLGEARPCLDADAMREGTPALDGEPLLRMEGPVGALLLVADRIAEALAWQTRAATAAARVARALPPGARLVESVLGRGVGDADAFARGAHVGCAHATTNLRAAERFGIPPAAGAGALGVEWWSAATRAGAFAHAPHALFVEEPADSPLAALRTALRLHAEHASRGGIGGVRLGFGADLPERAAIARGVFDAEGAADLAIAADARGAGLAALAEVAREAASVSCWEVAEALLDPALAPLAVTVRIEPADAATRLQVRRIERERRAVADLLHEAGWAPAPGASWQADAVTVDPERDESEPLLLPALRRGCREDDRESLAAIHDHARGALNRLPEELRKLVVPGKLALVRGRNSS